MGAGHNDLCGDVAMWPVAVGDSGERRNARLLLKPGVPAVEWPKQSAATLAGGAQRVEKIIDH